MRENAYLCAGSQLIAKVDLLCEADRLRLEALSYTSWWPFVVDQGFFAPCSPTIRLFHSSPAYIHGSNFKACSR
jgi:hypothetical protein